MRIGIVGLGRMGVNLARAAIEHGDPTERVREQLRRLGDAGDIVADGGNSHWEDSRGHHQRFAERGIHFLDAGTSGGLPGARHGACFMVGGEPAAGVEMLMRGDYVLDLTALFDNWSHGSVIRSWLVELMRDAVQENADLSRLSTYVEDTGEVKWVLSWAHDRDIPSPVISDSQQALMSYRDLDSPMAKAVALLRHGYGGHPVHERAESLVGPGRS